MKDRTAPPDRANPPLAELEARYAALQQAARSPGAEPGDVLDAAFTELEGAIDLLRAGGAAPAGPAAAAAEQHPGGAGSSSDSAERSLLRAAFQDTPVPLFLLTRDGTVQRVNKAAGDLIGAKPGYATGRPFTAFVNLPSRAAVNSQLTAVTRTGKPRRIRCSLLAADGLVPSELIIGTVAVRGEADPLMVAVRDTADRPPKAAANPSGAAANPSGAAASPFGAAASPFGAAASPFGAAASPSGAAASPSGAAASPSGAAASPSGAADRQPKAADRPSKAAGSASAGRAREAGDVPARDAADDAVDDAAGLGDDASRLGAVQAVTRRLDLVTAVARLLLENQGFSESRTLQRCARLIAAELTTWVIVDLERRHRLRRQFVLGPDDAGLAELTSAIAAVDPPPGSIPWTVHESGRPALIAHAEDTGVLGDGLDGEPLLVKMDATSVLSVPLADGENRYGVLTLVRRAADGHFRVADLALTEELGEQMALAIRVDRTFRRRSDTADALHASLLPRRMPEIPGLKIAATYIAAAEDPEVGGDFYDVYQTPDGWGMAVGDVCGKGEEAAAVTAAARHAIRVLARRCADPGEVLVGANEIVLAEEFALDGGFVTANIAHLSWLDGKLRVVIGSAGHPAAILLRADGRVRTMNGGGLPLGLFEDASPATQELTMDAGDVLFLYTDGVAQARGPNNTYFQDRLADELAGLAGSTAADLVASMRQAMLDFSAGNLIDDVTMLAVRVGRLPKGSASASVTSTARKTSTPSPSPNSPSANLAPAPAPRNPVPHLLLVRLIAVAHDRGSVPSSQDGDDPQ